MPKKKDPTCSYCERKSLAQVATKEIKRPRHICASAECWDAYYADCEATKGASRK